MSKAKYVNQQNFVTNNLNKSNDQTPLTNLQINQF